MKDKNSILRGGRAFLLSLRRKTLIGIFNIFSFSPDFLLLECLRRTVLSLYGIKFSSMPSIGDGFYALKGSNVTFGQNCTLGHFCRIYDWFPIYFGDKLFCSNHLTVVSASHDPLTYDSLPGPVTIGKNVWIGINVTIVGPVNIGNNVVIGAGSVVLKDIPDNAIAAGVPAKVIRMKHSSET